MQSQMKLSPSVQSLLRCPVCRAELQRVSDQLWCANADCNTLFPIIDGIPVLIDEAASLFSIDDYVPRLTTTDDTRDGGFVKALKQVIPGIGKNIKGKQNYGEFALTVWAHSILHHAFIL